jgi:L-threonylcarbamoyladenylate synthase
MAAERAQIGTDLQLAASILRDSGLVAIPTETVYGLAANALDATAVAGIFAAKNRPFFDPLIVHVASLQAVTAFVTDFPEALHVLAERYWPGPLTLLLPKADVIPDLVTAGSPRVAIRVPNHPIALALLAQLDFPLAAPSANPFGYISPTTAAHVMDQLGDNVGYILDGGPCAVGIESTIVGLDENQLPTIYRVGGLEQAAIETLIGPVQISFKSSMSPTLPGQLSSHYAPRTRVLLDEGLPPEALNVQPEAIGFVRFQTPLPGWSNQWVLSKTGDLREAAASLFSMLRLADAACLTLIVLEPAPEHGLGVAINDRLRRAATPRGL